ncbi:MAG TPA: cyclic nucleotide-binding domain-containing protein [Actinomycetota bacterium]|nr:cyclic nucleotide-binding domain-containing protein [Actinomycetota bacterium]
MAAEPRTATGLGRIVADLRASFSALIDSFRSPDLAKAQVAYLAFTIAEWAAFIALIVFAYEDGGSVMVGLVSLLQLIPAAILAPLGAVLGDRHRRERVLLFAHAALAAMTGLAALALLLDAPAPLVYLSATSAGWLLTLVRPTHASLLPRLAHRPEMLTSAYAASGLIESSSSLLGPLLAGGLMAVAGDAISGPGLVDAVLAAMLVVGTLCVATIRVRTEPAHEGASTGPRVLASEAVAGVRAVTRDRRSLLLVTAMGLSMVQLGFVDVLIVVLAFDVLGAGDAGVGFLTATIGVGAVVGAALAVGLAARARSSTAFRVGTSVGGVSLLGIAAVPSLAGGFLSVSGAGMTLADVNGRMMLQRLIPDKHLSRAFGVLESLYMAGEGIGSFVGSLLIVAIGPRATLVVAGLLLPVTVLAARRGLAGLDVGVRIPEREIELLRGTTIFAPLPAPMLERVARNLVPVAATEGATVIREGDHGDRFYAIVAGTVDVDVGGRVIATEGPGSCFGEIALLDDVPRTATVTARSDVRLLALDRDDFLRAVTGHEPSDDAARAFADRRKSEQTFGPDGERA